MKGVRPRERGHERGQKGVRKGSDHILWCFSRKDHKMGQTLVRFEQVSPTERGQTIYCGVFRERIIKWGKPWFGSSKCHPLGRVSRGQKRFRPQLFLSIEFSLERGQTIYCGGFRARVIKRGKPFSVRVRGPTVWLVLPFGNVGKPTPGTK
jgi:hypothetical protein